MFSFVAANTTHAQRGVSCHPTWMWATMYLQVEGDSRMQVPGLGGAKGPGMVLVDGA